MAGLRLEAGRLALEQLGGAAQLAAVLLREHLPALGLQELGLLVPGLQEQEQVLAAPGLALLRVDGSPVAAR